ncbi:nucleotidyltransferase domain-containing protein [Corallococcus exiguus]|uniref:DNA polymerase beta superfamily protein n=1 Tax=Corallococcus TaxID=83461 RepID=UPI000EA36F2C|nr:MULTISPECIES: nucleotidyltransferase domain-containing protein [Corallococcus]NNC17218.1 UDP-phosphate N-acetylglucosaminyl 1-phosphate transferase [Corallococcus exiguus]NRD54778.1 nucleotidyltransferase domain-containing protein [Corallococcus exiguus]NRD60685.1 nucleotidyltransferase domain-containing protein [Corallococcus exiguus]RKH24734.1 UDP-phosphate N-acetylglucosaminyl 1-phosphate transferase [Corallococcus sp. CA041A]
MSDTREASSSAPARVRGLEQIDRLSVPLPHGTEVTTRVERVASGGRRIPQGVVGRVVRAHDGGFDVQIVGVGEVWFARDELVPRRTGQVQFAQRREAAWSALRPCVVLETRVGSHAWGLADERSDVDVRGVFALPLPWTLGLGQPPQDLVSADGSTTYWEVRKTVEQALRADPNTLETLFVPGATAVDELGTWVLEAREAFVSKAIFGSFGRYAMSQLDKLTRSQRLAEHRDLLLAWLCEEPTPDLDEVARRLAAVSPRASPTPEDAVLAAKTYVKQLYRSLWDQGLLASNDFAALTAYARGGGQRPPSARELRPKNAYNLLRLVALATGWLRDGVPTFEATGALKARLLDIKGGQVPLEDVLRDAEAMAPALEAAHRESQLPEHPDYARADQLLRRVGDEVARRWVLKTPGPLGRDAPEAPALEGGTE